MSFALLSWNANCGDWTFFSSLPSLLSLSVNAIVLNQLTATLPGLVSPQPPFRAKTLRDQEQPGTRSQHAAPPFRAASLCPWRAMSHPRGCLWPAWLLLQGNAPVFPSSEQTPWCGPSAPGCSAAPRSFAAAWLLPNAVQRFAPGDLEDKERV